MQTGHRSDTITVKFYGEYSRPPRWQSSQTPNCISLATPTLAGLISFRTGCAATVGTRVPLASTALRGNNPVRPSSQFARYVRGEFEMGAGLNRCLMLPIVVTGSCTC
jgi:hypothetical protein